MSQVLEDLLYTKDHLWVLVEDAQATIGVTDFGQHLIGDVTIADLPEDDREVHAGDQIASLQGRDDDLDVASPVSGVIVEVNQDLENAPELINQDNYGAGWIVRVDIHRPAELDRLLTAEQYEEFLAREEEDL